MQIVSSLVTCHSARSKLLLKVKHQRLLSSLGACQLPSYWSPSRQVSESQWLMLALQEHFADQLSGGITTNNECPLALTAVSMKQIILLFIHDIYKHKSILNNHLALSLRRLISLTNSVQYFIIINFHHLCCFPQGFWFTMADYQEEDLQKFLKDVDEISKYQ